MCTDGMREHGKKKLSLCDKCRWQGWSTSIFNNYIPKRACMAYMRNDKEEPMEYCPFYKYSKRTEDMYKEYYENKASS